MASGRSRKYTFRMVTRSIVETISPPGVRVVPQILTNEITQKQTINSGVARRACPYLAIQRDYLRLVGHAWIVGRTAGGQRLLGHQFHLAVPDAFVDAVFSWPRHRQLPVQRMQS